MTLLTTTTIMVTDGISTCVSRLRNSASKGWKDAAKWQSYSEQIFGSRRRHKHRSQSVRRLCCSTNRFAVYLRRLRVSRQITAERGDCFGLVTSVTTFALIKYALDGRRRSAPGTTGQRLFSLAATGWRADVGYVSVRRRADVRPLLTIRDGNRAMISLGSAIVRFEFVVNPTIIMDLTRIYMCRQNTLYYSAIWCHLMAWTLFSCVQR